jgi:GNAT superfamily N-acetyltransferase
MAATTGSGGQNGDPVGRLRSKPVTVAWNARSRAERAAKPLRWATGGPTVSGDSVTIRTAEPHDFVPLCRIDNVAQVDAGRRMFIAQAIRERRCRLVAVRRVPRGYAIISHAFFGRSILDLVFIEHGWRSRGLGRSLIRAMEPLSRSASLFTSTNRSNEPMRHLLENLGYAPSGVIYNLDADDPECVFVKHLIGVSGRGGEQDR